MYKKRSTTLVFCSCGRGVAIDSRHFTLTLQSDFGQSPINASIGKRPTTRRLEPARIFGAAIRRGEVPRDACVAPTALVMLFARFPGLTPGANLFRAYGARLRRPFCRVETDQVPGD